MNEKFHSDSLSFKDQTRNTYIQAETEAVKKNISLTIKEDIPKNSAIPPHTPNNALSVCDFVNFIKRPLNKTISTYILQYISNHFVTSYLRIAPRMTNIF